MPLDPTDRARVSRLNGFAVVVLGLSVISIMLAAAPAGAATGRTVLCESSTYSCVGGTGYAGKASWGYPGPHNCTLYAAYRLSQNGYSDPSGLGNAYDWDARALQRGVKVDTSPVLGSIAQRDGSGHVMYVEEVSSTYIVVTEDNWLGPTRRVRIERSGDYFASLEFIHFKDLRDFSDGTLLRVAETGEVYVVAGGAPLYVSTWAAFGGAKPVVTIGQAVLNSLPHYPADGTLIKGGQTGEVYVVAGGAPIYVSTWAALGGSKPVVTVDQVAIDQAGGSGRLSHMRSRPADGTLIKGGQTGEVYVVAGGAPIYVSTWAALGGSKPVVTVDQVAIDQAGGSGRLSHMRSRPADGTLIKGGQTGEVYVVAGGAPIYVSTWAALGGSKPVVTVDQVAIDQAGGSGRLSHMRYRPADGTFIKGGQTGRVYRVDVAGVARYVPTWTPYGGPQPVVTVDQVSIDNAGSGGRWNHIAGVVN